MTTTFYVKFERKIPALIADFCTYYAPHANHTVIFYYDATALGSNYAVNDQNLSITIRYTKNGVLMYTLPYLKDNLSAMNTMEQTVLGFVLMTEKL